MYICIHYINYQSHVLDFCNWVVYNLCCRNLVNLNDNSDPGWEAITYMKQYIIDKIKTSYQHYITEEQASETSSELKTF